MDINAIDFVSRWKGMWGGLYNGTPDKGLARLVHDQIDIFSTRFFYDRLGRIVVSQNTKQFNYPIKAYSYTLYDALGRVVEAGEKTENGLTDLRFVNIFGTTIENYYSGNTIDDADLLAWVNGNGARKEVTHTYYDTPVYETTLSGVVEQKNLRKRVASVTYEKLLDTQIEAFDHATHYSYDIHGNVNVLVQDFPEMELGLGASGFRFKSMYYKYDLISGNVLQVSYQPGKADQFYHRYEYDADNRITDVYTTNMGWASGQDLLTNIDMPWELPYWEKDATYRYYLHGPLARVEVGDLGVQGVDYAYTLQGWLKTVNGDGLEAANDMGQDGKDMGLGTASVNSLFAQDVMSFSLHYQDQDYEPIGGDQPVSVVPSGTALGDQRNNLWNGNIGAMITSLQAPVGSDYTAGAKLIQGMAYKYDQLNRLKTAVGYNSTNSSNTTAPFVWAGSGAQRYANSFTYDANGNILTQSRADQANVVFDNLSYAYDYDQDGFLKNNRLRRVDDAVSGSLPLDDIEDQGSAYNYVYDAIGQLVLDNQEQIASIDWRIDGKIASINRTSGSGKADLDFEYDALGNRVAKKVVNGGQLTETIYYIRDANGEVMAVYQFTLQQEQAHLKLQEQHIYGSARLGVKKVDEEMIGAVDPSDVGEFDRVRGMKRYELSNHLGNVLTVISDRKIATVDNGVNIYYHAEIISYSDYYPFGAPMSQSNTDRTWSVEEYRFGFNGQEKELQITGFNTHTSAEFWMYDSRLGRRLNVDPKPLPSSSLYSCFTNSPLLFNDINGDTARINFAYQDESGKHCLKEIFRFDDPSQNTSLTINEKDIPESIQGAVKAVVSSISEPQILTSSSISENPKADAIMASIGVSAGLVAGAGISLDLVKPNKGEESGHWMIYFSYQPALTAGGGVSIVMGDVDVSQAHEGFINHKMFAGASNVYSFGVFGVYQSVTSYGYEAPTECSLFGINCPDDSEIVYEATLKGFGGEINASRGPSYSTWLGNLKVIER